MHGITLFKLLIYQLLFCKVFAANEVIETSVTPFNNTQRFKRQTCSPKATFKYCKNSETDNPMWNLNKRLPTFVNIIVEAGCPTSKIYVKWELIDKKTRSSKVIFHEFENQHRLLIEKNFLDASDYILCATVTETSAAKKKISKTIECWMRINTWKVVPYLRGGNKINVFPNEKVQFDGSLSDGFDILHLQYKWKCESEKKFTECDNLQNRKGKVAVIPIKGDAGQILNVTFTMSANDESKSYLQTVEVIETNKPRIEILCGKNCYEDGRIYSDPAVGLYLKATCKENCKRVSYLWEIKEGRGSQYTGADIIQYGTEFGKTSKKLYIKKNILTYDVEYKMILYAMVRKKKVGSAYRTIEMTSQAHLKCKIEPKEGISLITTFEIFCLPSPHKRPVTFELQQLYSKAGLRFPNTLAYSTIPQFYDIKLSRADQQDQQTLIITTQADTMEMSAMGIMVKITSCLNDIKEESLKILELKNIYSGKKKGTISVKNLFRLGKFDEAIQIISAIASELENIKDTDEGNAFKTEIQTKMLNDLLNNFPKDKHRLNAMLVLDKITHEYEPKDIGYAKAKSKLCKYVSQKMDRTLSNQQNPYLYNYALTLYSKVLQDCGEEILDNKFKKPFGFNLTTPKPVPVHGVVEEDYPNYKDEIDALEHDYKSIMKDSISSLRSIGHAFAQTFAAGEPQVKMGDYSNMTLDIDYADFLSRKQYFGPGVILQLPDSLGIDKEAELKVVFTAFSKDAFFWDEQGRKMSTPIVDLHMFTRNDTNIVNVPNAINIYFDVTDTSGIEFYDGSVTVTRDPRKWERKYIDSIMAVYRLNVENGTTLMVAFEDISPVEEILVVLKKYSRPSFDDFKNAKVIRHNGTVTIFSVTENVWYYVAILPKKEDAIAGSKSSTPQLRLSDEYDDEFFSGDYTLQMNTADDDEFTISFAYSFMSQICLKWDEEKWGASECEISNTSASVDTIHCECHVITTMGGQSFPVQSKADPIKNITLKLILVTNYIVFLCTFIVFFMYCLALCFVLIRLRAQTFLYFLSDNIKDERYAYLIVVKTGHYGSAGTTSNITIKLFGKNCESKAHVLNYPDPDKNILQQSNRDLFILTSENHLGSLLKIQVWFDCVGYRPCWYCENIRIYDLQTEDYWYFKLHEWFTLLEKNKHFFIIEPSTEKTLKSKAQLFGFMRFYFGPEHTWNIFTRADDKSLLYIERITVMLSHILCVYVATLIICSPPTLRLRDGLGVNYFTVYNFIIMAAFVIALLSFVINMTFIFLFRHTRRLWLFSHLRHENKLFPAKVLQLTWVLLILTIVLCISYLVIFGFWISKISSDVWLAVTTIALLIDIFIFENIYIAANNILSTIFDKKFKSVVTYNYKAIIEETEKQRKVLYGILGSYALRPYLTHLYSPLPEETLVERRRKQSLKVEIATTLHDMIVFLLYILLLYMLLYVTMDTMSAISNRQMYDMIYNAAFTRTKYLDYVFNFDDIYTYLNTTLVPILHPTSWYGDWNVSDPGLMADFNNKILGVARIRQKRMLTDTCQLTRFAKLLNFTYCNYEYFYRGSDRGDGGTLQEHKRWSYHNESEALILGEMGFYGGDGYTAKLGRNINNAYFMIKLLKDNNWLDKYTRVVFIEFWTYNANANLFNFITVMFEKSATQLLVVSVKVYTARLVYSHIRIQLVTLVVSSIFGIVVLNQLLNYIVRLIKYHKSYLKSFWHILEFIIVGMNVCLLVLMLHKRNVVKDLLQELESAKHSHFVSYFSVITVSQYIGTASAILICIAILRLWKFMRFMIMFRVFERTLLRAAVPILTTILYKIILMCMYGFYGYIVFGPFSENYRSLLATSITFLQLSLDLLNNFDFKILRHYHPYISIIYYSYIMVTILLMRTIFITVLILCYEESRQFYSSKLLSYSIKDYIKEEWSYFSQLWRRKYMGFRLRAGEDLSLPEKELVTPKAYEHRYADCVLMPSKKLESMALIARGVIRNLYFKKDKLTNVDIKLMGDVLQNAANIRRENVTSDSIFFKASNKEGKVKFVSDNTLLQMQYVTKRLLTMSKETFDVEKERLTIKDENSLRRIYRIEHDLSCVDIILGNIHVVTQTMKKKTQTKTKTESI